MLYEIAALLSTSGALGSVAEAFGVHEIHHQVVSNVVMVDPSQERYLSEYAVGAVGDGAANTDGQPLISTISPWSISGSVGSSVSSASSAQRLDVSLLPSLTGRALLDQLSLLPKGDLAQFVSKHPGSVKQLLANPLPASEVASWWASTSATGRAALRSAAPELVGNLGGMPYTVRDTANRRYLGTTIDALKESMEQGIGRGEVVAARARLHMLEQVRDSLVTTKSEPPRHLVSFDAAGVGRAAVVVGDLTTADYVSYLVPGMFFTVDGQMVDWTVIAQDLNKEQTGWVSRLAKTDPTMVGKKVATVAWIGYQTPGLTGIASLGLADEGAKQLGIAIDGLHAVRSGNEPFVTIVGHSYGSTAAMIELAKGGIDVDALVLIGSPGSAVQTASELSVPGNNVYVGEAAWDPVVNTAFYGSDPGSAAFGAHKMDVAGGVDPITHKTLAPAIGHLGYFDAGTAAMRNVALIGLGRGSLVTNGTTLDASRTLDGTSGY